MRKKRIKISGIVTECVMQKDAESYYKIKSGGKEYVITSIGRQAIKDSIFIRKGQHMIIEGKETAPKGAVLSKASKILLEVEGALDG